MAYEGASLAHNIDIFGDAAERLAEYGCDPYVLKPFRGKDGRNYFSAVVNGVERVIVTNAPATLSYDSWKLFDSVVDKTVQEEANAVADVRAAGLERTLPNGMAHTVLQYQKQGDITQATVSMDPVRRSEADRPTTDIGLLPLPIIHKDFDYTFREVLASKLGNMPLDTDTAALATVKVVQEAEKMLLGTVDPYYAAGGYIYGYRTHPSRATNFSMTAPTGSNGPTVVNEVLGLLQLLINDLQRGPFRVYVNMQWMQFLDNDFSTLKGDGTLRQRLLAIDGISSVKINEFLPNTNYEIVVVSMRSSTVRMVIGMEPMLMQWESQGGNMRHYKVAAMWIPHVRANADGNIGIAHGRSTTA